MRNVSPAANKMQDNDAGGDEQVRLYRTYSNAENKARNINQHDEYNVPDRNGFKTNNNNNNNNKSNSSSNRSISTKDNKDNENDMKMKIRRKQLVSQVESIQSIFLFFFSLRI